MPLFITFEGGEGCGKSTQVKRLYKRLAALRFSVLLAHEPGSTPLGNRIRSWLKWGGALTPELELLLFNAARAQLVAEVIRPALSRGETVLCDRFADSTTAYQGYGRELDLGLVMAVNSVATGDLRPDLTVLLDIDVAEGLRRKRRKQDRFEREDVAFHQRVRQGYLKMAAADPGRWLVVDAALPAKKVEDMVWQRVQPLLARA